MAELRIAQKLGAGVATDGLPGNPSADGIIQADANTVQVGIQPLLIINPDLGIPAKPSVPLVQEVSSGFVVTWDGANADGTLERVADLDHVEVYVSAFDGFAPTPDSGAASIPATGGNQKGGSVYVAAVTTGTNYIRLVAVARSGNEGPASEQGSGQMVASDTSALQGQIDALNQQQSDMSVDVASLETEIQAAQDTIHHKFVGTKPIAMANTPSPGYIHWPPLTLFYNGVEYFISGSATVDRYVYWLYNDGAGGDFVTSPVQPTLGPDDLLVFINKGGVPIDVQLTSFIDGTLLVNGTVVADAVVANALNGQIITGSTLQTAASGPRFAVYDVTHLPGQWGALGLNQATAFFFTGASNTRATETQPCAILCDPVGLQGLPQNPTSWQSTLTIMTGQYTDSTTNFHPGNNSAITLASVSTSGQNQATIDLWAQNINLHGPTVSGIASTTTVYTFQALDGYWQTFGTAGSGDGTGVVFNKHVTFQNADMFWSNSAAIASSAPPLGISSTRVGRAVSSAKYKTDINDLVITPEKILALRPVTYRPKDEAEGDRVSIGLIAEEVAEHIPELVHYEEGEPDAIYYDRLPVAVLSLVQRLTERVDKLEARVAELEAR